MSVTPLYLRDKEAAQLLGISVHTLRKYRPHRVGPPYIKMRGNVLYYRADLEAYMESLKVSVA